jgi:hypothetical protein
MGEGPKAKDAVTWYDFARINSSVRRSGRASFGTDIGDIIKLIEEWETQA